MPKVSKYSSEFKDQSVRLVFAEIGPQESRKGACDRLGARLGVKPVTLYNWVKAATPTAQPVRPAGSVEDLRAQNAALKKENRELARANEILQAAASFFGAELDRHSRK